ncbi:unnamed protein product [Leptosia nina]|uniref:Neural proliferation differentiation and control protein 1 n=1 Tax=Leptosia nina TaxID=320188 RepID=A0AAV1K099_9NEOP
MYRTGVALAVVLIGAFGRQPGSPFSPVACAMEPPDKEQSEPEMYREIVLSPYEPHYIQYEDSPRVYVAHDFLAPLGDDLLSKEIALLKRLETLSQLEGDYNIPLDDNQDRPSIFLNRLLNLQTDRTPNNPKSQNPYDSKLQDAKKDSDGQSRDTVKEAVIEGKTKEELELEVLQKNDRKRSFALTPLEDGYYDATSPPSTDPSKMSKNQLLEPRKTRQNPNLSRAKALVAENLDELRHGFTDKDTGSTIRPHHIHIIESIMPEQATSIYSSALLAAIIAALSMAAIGFVFGWYTLSKKAKAAADVDYPAYGVTGPTVDPSGDRKLAHSAHMYHYQHQKQQILAMESCLGRNGSISDPDSEEENEEGDYTVYECPGFATTGNMEVKNPLFHEDPTPATPGKCEVVQPQPKD